MKKIFCAFLMIFLFASSAFSEKNNTVVGVLAQLNMDEEAYKKFVMDGRETIGWSFLSAGDENYRFYDSLLALQMALNSGEIGEVQLPEVVAEYFLLSNKSLYTISCVSQTYTAYLAFGFLKENTAMQEKFNEAMKFLKESGTLDKIISSHITDVKDVESITHVKFERFEGAETIQVALTGDLPPIDFIATDGTPAGFNMAILAEIGKYLKVNIRVFSIESGARSAALASGKADAAFWYKGTKNSTLQPDIPDSIIISEPYYEWNKFVHIKKAR